MRKLSDRSHEEVFAGVYWSYIAFAGPRLITFVSSLALARLVGPHEFGLFAAALLIIQFFDAIHDLGVGPAIIQSRQRSETLVGSALTVSLAMAIPLSGGLFVAAPAPQLVHVLYSDKWSEAAPVMQLLALNAVLISLAMNAGDVWKATGNALRILQLACIGTIAAVPFFVLGSHWGLVGIASARLIVTAAMTVVYLNLIMRSLRIQLSSLLRVLWAPTVSTVFMASSCYFVLSASASEGPTVQLVVTFLTGIIAYATAIKLTDSNLAGILLGSVNFVRS